MEITPWLFVHLIFRKVFRGSKTDLFPEHLFFLISNDIKENHIPHCMISEREKQDSLGTKLRQLKLNTRDLLYGKTRRGQTESLGLAESQP